MPPAAASARTAFGALVSQTARRWRRAVDQKLQPFGLTEATWLPLLRLARAPKPMRQKELAASLSLDNSSVVRLLDGLEAAGLIERRDDADDRRAKAIVLTAAGRKTVDRVEKVAREIRDEALSGLSDREVETASRVLDHVCRVLTDDAEEGGR
jgi:MarR family transcriptional regulator, transcriptional regulator for hemolysin